MNIVDSREHGPLAALELEPLMRQRCAEVGVECEVPRLVGAPPHPQLTARSLIIRVGEQRNAVLEITMPCGEAKLLWMPWLPHQRQPSAEPGDYHHLNYGVWSVMPRRTKCYGSAYAFSGQVHPVEPSTPPAVRELYAETSRAFGLQPPAVPNMCLENCYANGREYISEHSDDERQFGELKDVFCWSVGCARPAVFRVKQLQHKVPPHLQALCGPGGSREVLSIQLPAGLYVMQGRQFQQRYTHEFPQLHEPLFKRLVRELRSEPDFPTQALSSKGAPMTSLAQAAWIQANRAAAEKVPPRRGKTVAEERRELDEWCSQRTSYTLRNFQSPS